MQTTLDRLIEVFREVFDDEAMLITRKSSAHDFEDWDSLMHVTLMINVEKEFNVRFSSSEVAGLKDVGELIDLIEAKSRP